MEALVGLFILGLVAVFFLFVGYIWGRADSRAGFRDLTRCLIDAGEAIARSMERRAEPEPRALKAPPESRISGRLRDAP